MTVAIVILNYKTADLTVACLKSVAEDAGKFTGETGNQVRVVVVDNFSNDGSVETIATEIHQNGWSWMSVLPLPRNGGFAFGNNRGMEMVKEAEYVLLLNSDTALHGGVLRTCYNVMDRDPTIGVMSVMLRSADGSVQNVARKFPTPLRAAVSSLGLPWLAPVLFRWADIEDSGWDRATCGRDVDWLGGAFMFIRATALRKIGPLDQTFFFYGEDIEFCHRMAKAGFRRRYDPSAMVTHIGGASTRRNAELLRRRARYQVQRKCYGETAACVVGTIDIIASWLRSLRPGRIRNQ